jgi:hypothetical protein
MESRESRGSEPYGSRKTEVWSFGELAGILRIYAGTAIWFPFYRFVVGGSCLKIRSSVPAPLWRTTKDDK